jgi:Tol biopolymer transport system component
MAPDGTNQVRLTSDLRDPSTVPGRGPSVIVFRWSSSLRRFLFSTTYNGRLKSVDASGRDVALVTELAPYFDLSPDGRSIAICSLANDPVSPDLDLLSLDGTELTQLTDRATREALGLSASARFGGLAWSPDGNKIAFSCNDTTAGLCWINADGTDPERILAPMSIAESGGFAWSPDGRYLLFTTLAKSAFALHKMQVESHTVTTLLEDGVNFHPFWSPDGKRIVLSRGYPNSPAHIWVMNADGTGLTQLTFEGQNCCPVWLP